MNNDIISLLGERVEKFTMRDSTSVTKETAERILGSILYCIKSDSNNTIKNSTLDKSLIKEENLDIRTAFYNGLLILKELSLEEEIFYTYFKLDIKEFVKELYLYKEQNLLNIVISLRKKYTFKEKEHFQDGDLIDDNILRKIIDEINECHFLYDKIEIIKRNIKSLRDLKELLNECFYENEFKYVFDMLSNEEINVMLKDIKEKKAFQEYLCEWEEALIKYVKNKKEM